MADKWLGVAQLLTPEELINPNVDELSMMTYLAQFREAKVKEGAPILTENQNSQLIGSGMESFEPPLIKDAAGDQKPAAAKQSEEPQQNIECMDKAASNPSSLFKDARKEKSLDNLSEGGRRSCCSYFLVVLIAVIVAAFISTRQYDS